MQGLLEGKVAVITGAGSGVGRAAVRLWTQHGAKVIAADIDLPSAEESVKLAGAPQGAAKAVACNVADPAQVEAAVQLAVETFGRLDVMYNNAGITVSSRPGGGGLRPLTDQLPKPLIPVFHRPLITFAFDHLIAAGVKEFIVNTHHLSQCYAEAFPNQNYRDASITFRHEPVLLETAGGIANIADLVRDESFLVYNGDILTDLPLAPLLKAHAGGENIVTLALRSHGPSPHIAFDSTSGCVTDIRNRLGTGNSGTHLFTGIYTVRPDFLAHLEPGKIESVIPIFLGLIQQGARIGAVVIDEGQWWDLGDKSSYLAAHHALHELGANFPAYEKQNNPRTAISASACIYPSAKLHGLNVISAGATVGAGAVLENCILWPNATVAANVHLREVIVRMGCSAAESQTDSVV